MSHGPHRLQNRTNQRKNLTNNGGNRCACQIRQALIWQEATVRTKLWAAIARRKKISPPAGAQSVFSLLCSFLSRCSAHLHSFASIDLEHSHYGRTGGSSLTPH